MAVVRPERNCSVEPLLLVMRIVMVVFVYPNTLGSDRKIQLQSVVVVVVVGGVLLIKETQNDIAPARKAGV